MFCPECGNELKDDVRFCNNCGTKVGVDDNSVLQKNPTAEIKVRLTEHRGNFASGVVDVGKNKVLLLANIALLLLSFIFAMTDTFKVDAIFGINKSMSMFDDMGGLRFFCIVGYILSIACVLIPLLLKKAWKPMFFLPAKITTIAVTAWFFLVLVVGLSEVSSSGYSSMAEFSPTTAGWIFILVTIGAIVLSFKLAMDFKKQMR